MSMLRSRGDRFGRSSASVGPAILAGAVTVLVAAVAVTSAARLHTLLVLPVVSVVLVLAAAAAAAIAWFTRAHSEGEAITYWDVAGALTLFGFFAALLSEPEQVLPLLEQAQARR